MVNKKHPMGDIAITNTNLPPWALYARPQGGTWELMGEFGDRNTMDAHALALGLRGLQTKPVYRRDHKFATGSSTKVRNSDR